MRSTDLEVSRHLHLCINLGMQNALAHNSGRSAPGWCPFWAFNAHLLPISGVERQNHACSGRSVPAPLQGAILAFSAQMMPILGVQRPDTAHFGRSAPEPCSVLALNARQMLLQGVIFLLRFLIPFPIFIFIL